MNKSPLWPCILPLGQIGNIYYRDICRILYVSLFLYNFSNVFYRKSSEKKNNLMIRGKELQRFSRRQFAGLAAGSAVAAPSVRLARDHVLWLSKCRQGNLSALSGKRQ